MPGDPPLVSVLMTTYNRASLVQRALDSVRAQTYPQIEIVVVDDGSVDRTSEVLASYCRDPRVRVVRHESNRGVAAAKNTALDSARGEYSIVFDSDDELVPRAIETLVDTLEGLGPAYGMVFADCVDPASGELTGRGFEESGEATYEDAICRRFSGEFVGLWRTSLVEGLRFDERLPGGENLVWHRIYQRTRVYYLKAVLQKYYRADEHSDAVSAEPFANRVKHRQLALARELYIEQFGRDIERASPRSLAHLYQVLALYQTIGGMQGAALRSGMRALRLRPTPLHLALLALPFVPRPLLRAMLEAREAMR